jgi:hypothetical protein
MAMRKIQHRRLVHNKPWEVFGHGRIPSRPDERDKNFPLRLLQEHLRAAAPAVPIPDRRTLPLGWRGDQLRTSWCVGFTGEGCLRTTPGKQRLSGLTASAIYQGAQMYDEIPGEGYAGTTTRGLMEFLVNYHPAEDVQSYWWVHNVDETIAWIGGKDATPVAWGINWYPSMYTPDGTGRVKVEGSAVDGHEVLQIGYIKRKGLLVYQNSWGREWGDDGRFYLSLDDAQRLLEEDGEAAVAVKYPKYQRPA